MTATGAVPQFWRDPALPFLEARSIQDGRALCYAPHSHESFSIGTVLGGRSRYRNGPTRELVGAGTLVLMNPGDVHACNPQGEDAWRYRMLHVDATWLAGLQRPGADDFQPLAVQLSGDVTLYAGLEALHACLVAPDSTTLQRQSRALLYFEAVLARLGRTPVAMSLRREDRRLRRAAEFLDAHCGEGVSLDQLSQVADLSPTQLIRSFRRRYGLTPHAYLIDRRIRLARQRLRQGEELAEVALATGFADQAHLQRTFKRLVAATPGQYRAASTLPQQ
ncbi:AraC family transcriptional regulator [Pseudomonas oryzihabitans]|uniref:AraC family transcriptional regulator n=1 Tax=Pseudomonas oryzihabitans TaxID=47885 RepID=UPI00135DF8B3|nr:AraC family transcriptional regulator [Pseudomonas oryzihabitans]MXS19768.1 helix-turn-helix domain-containing protein [Pseudomonas oryzihabitans]